MAYVLVVLGAVARLVPHPWNFAPIGAFGLFAGASCSPRTAWAVPLAALLVADAITGFYDVRVMAFVYLGFAAGPFIGRALLGSKRTLVRYGAAVWSAATVFFMVSNLGAWLAYYPQTAAGLVECYVRALPFYGVTLLGDSVYAGILFGSQAWLARSGRVRAPATPGLEPR